MKKIILSLVVVGYALSTVACSTLKTASSNQQEPVQSYHKEVRSKLYNEHIEG